MTATRPVDPHLAQTFLKRFTSPKHAKTWIHNFLDLDFPDSWVDPDSNSSPVHWLYETYKMYEANLGHTSPSTIVISSRESYKTLSEAAFAIIMMVQFGASIAHMAAIVPQATAAQNYISMFIDKIKPYLEYHKIELDSSNAKEISLKLNPGTPEEKQAYMKIIVCTVTGANSSHTNIFTIDEIDTIRSREQLRAYKEAEYIPGVFNGQHPVTIKTSTLKFPGGLFTKEMEKAQKSGHRVFRWNIIDITEKCQPARHKPDKPKQWVYVARSLPLRTITETEWANLIEKEREGYDKVEAYEGCLKCPLLPVCRTRLAHRSEKDVGGLWKPIDFTISQFDKDPDLAEAQLMCWKPSSAGMVYPRFVDMADGTGNTYTLKQAWEAYTGEAAPKGLVFPDLIQFMLSKGVRFYAGVDWGTTHAFAISVSAKMANGEWWLVDGYSVPGLEFAQMMALATEVRDMYRVAQWYADTSEPMFIKEFKNARMPCKKFTKDVFGGISAVRGRIINARNRRFLKVIKHDRTELFLKMFAEHCFKLDTLGNLTKDPDDGEFADIADSVRYQAQNLYKVSKINTPPPPQPVNPFEQFFATVPTPEKHFQDWQTQKRQVLDGGDTSAGLKGKSGDGNVIWDFGSEEGTDE